DIGRGESGRALRRLAGERVDLDIVQRLGAAPERERLFDLAARVEEEGGLMAERELRPLFERRAAALRFGRGAALREACRGEKPGAHIEVKPLAENPALYLGRKEIPETEPDAPRLLLRQPGFGELRPGAGGERADPRLERGDDGIEA